MCSTNLVLADLAAEVFAVIGVVLTAFKVISEWKSQRLQRMQDHSWKRAKEAYDIVDELLTDALARQALYMLDWDGRRFQLPDGTREPIETDAMLKALRVGKEERFNDREQFVRDCFDELFGYYGRMEHALTIDLVDFEALRFPSEYYVGIMTDHKRVFDTFLRSYGYSRSISFLSRFAIWTETGSS